MHLRPMCQYNSAQQRPLAKANQASNPELKTSGKPKIRGEKGRRSTNPVVAKITCCVVGSMTVPKKIRLAAKTQ